MFYDLALYFLKVTSLMSSDKAVCESEIFASMSHYTLYNITLKVIVLFSIDCVRCCGLYKRTEPRTV